MRNSSQKRITELLGDLEGGNRTALDRLMPAVYDQLRAIAARKLRGGKRHEGLLQTTALVHEVYLRLTRDKHGQWKSRGHFFAFAALLIRRILVDQARREQAVKRGGERGRVPLYEETIALGDKDIDLIALDEALKRLAEIDRRQSQIVELRYFGGLSVEETAAALEVSVRTVERGWTMARAWLFREISKGDADGP